MPLYTFRCKKCKQVTQVWHGFLEPHPETCENTFYQFEEYDDLEIADPAAPARLVAKHCGGRLVRIFDQPNITYRGGGFYHTDKVLSDPINPLDEDD